MRSSTRSDIDPFIVMDVMEAARKAEAAGRRIIHMEVGQPGTPAPATARDAVAGALNSSAMVLSPSAETAPSKADMSSNMG